MMWVFYGGFWDWGRCGWDLLAEVRRIDRMKVMVCVGRSGVIGMETEFGRFGQLQRSVG